MAHGNREIHLKSRPVGMPTEADFELVDGPIPSPAQGEVLVRNLWMSVDPYMRGRMMDRKGYASPFQVGGVLDGGSCGQVVESNGGRFQVGDTVCAWGSGGWREYYVSKGVGLYKVDPSGSPLQSYLGILGMPGLTAYASLLRIGEPKEGQTVFVSAASGAVGSAVCQIARIRGCRVVGSVGSAAKARWLCETAGVNAAIDYKTCGDLQSAVARECPDGIDIYYENVGGAHLEAALNLMNPFGRIVMCGMISHYNDEELHTGPPNLIVAVAKSLRMQGFVVSNYLEMLPEFLADMRRWIEEGSIVWEETVVDGIENAPAAFLGLFRGENIGKMLVRLAPSTG